MSGASPSPPPAAGSSVAEALERERRWRRPAGIAAILGAVAVQAGLIVNGSALGGDGTAERLLEAAEGDADGQLLAGVLIAGLGFVLLAVTVTFFFRAALARTDRMMRGLLPLGAVGALMIATGLVLSNSAYLDAADDFAASEAEREAASERPAAEAQGGGEGGGAQGGGQEGGAAQPGAEQGKTTTVQPTTTTTETAGGDEDEEEDADDRATDALNDASGASTAAILYRGGAFVFSIGFLYAALWSMRTGLLSRFWGSLGMASAVVLGLFFLYFFSLIWFLAMGLFLLGAWFGTRPPAWETGTARPWPKPGQPPPEDSGADAVEGRGRELEEPGGEADYSDRPQGEAGPPPRKRKRRR